MIRFEMPAGGSSGFDLGQLCVGGVETQECFESMVVLSATLLLDQLAAWSSSVPVLIFHPADSREHIEFRRAGWRVQVWARGRCVEETTEAELRASALRASSELFESYAVKLDVNDAGRQDLEAALADARRRTARERD